MRMKRSFSLFMALLLAVLIAACQNAGAAEDASGQETSTAVAEQAGAAGTGSADMESTDTEPTSAAESEEAVSIEGKQTGAAEGNGKLLVAYFSWADNAALAEDVDAVASPSVIPPGNVQQLAGWVQEETGGDLFSIRVTEPYPSGWDECLSRANEERGSGARPELVENVEDMEQYDTVFLGYPNWWYGVPMALLSFLEQNDLTGKQVYLFCSHGTGGLANSVELITEAAPDAVISDDIFDCYEEEAASSREEIQSWVRELGFGRSDDREMNAQTRRISVQFGENMVIYELNDGTAADSLYEQLPLTVEAEDYSTNEKIFYPPQALDTSDSPLAQAGAGTLAYYEPWGDVVFFYGSYNGNSSLFELGQAVSGGELVGEMTGTITMEAVE
ncbi:MAG TPA: hypothetical protein H9717_10575 [Candidatus Eisenbergiella merdipullorum]|uniref:Flavodoxin n=1 Tax=Candidatus Eisenbergiella merdipullorum TaxID=2838553 RepID=A0A9D2L0M0_9FIRM|nr:hypothetical protein [Candidatus Eisenbergiella merdipullorum]